MNTKTAKTTKRLNTVIPAGRSLAIARVALGVSGRELANAAGVSHTTLTQVEALNRLPTNGQIPLLFATLGKLADEKAMHG
jgi:transcriptional regulator with XRE-family HTH domain